MISQGFLHGQSGIQHGHHDTRSYAGLLAFPLLFCTVLQVQMQRASQAVASKHAMLTPSGCNSLVSASV